MRNVVVENTGKVAKQIMDYGRRIRGEVSYVILGVGDSVVSDLQVKYPDLTITGQYFQNNMEYWIGISQFGTTLTWIKCPVSNLFFERDRDAQGKQQFASTAPKLEQSDVDMIVERITNELSLQIKQILGRKV